MCEDQQQEEIEVLQSIYEGDNNFKQINEKTFLYKYGEDGNNKSFTLEITWTEGYPEVQPQVNVDTFYNKHILQSVKDKIKEGIFEQIPDLIGCAMTFTLFEWVKENVESLLEDQPEVASAIEIESKVCEPQLDVPKVKEKKEQLTKNQKRKMYDRINAAGERPRGWNWVDVIKHLSQTGGKT